MREIEQLLAWDVEAGRLAEMREALRRRPAYPAAVRRLAANLLKEAEEDASLNAMLRDAGHNVAALSALYLHASGEISLTRLKAFIAGFGLVSAGRARALLSLMLHLKFLEPDPGEAPGRRTLYRVTPQFLASYTRHEASVLDAVRVVEPAVGLLLDNLDRASVLHVLALEQGDAFVRGRAQPQHAGLYRAFLHRRGGIQILHALVAAAPDFPPEGPLAFSPGEAARRFGVSRVHVARMIDDAEAQGLVEPGPGSLSFTEAGREALDWAYGSRLSLHLACAARTLKANPELMARATC